MTLDHLKKAAAFEHALRDLLGVMGEDPDREGLKMTPHRVRKALLEMTAGYKVNPADLVVTFADDNDEMVLVKDVPFSSLCEHHLLPFVGAVTVGYVPDGRVVGLSKIPRIVQSLSARLQLQERLTKEVADCLFTHSGLKPRGAAVLVRASHSCMCTRGARSHGQMVTSHLTGVFRTDPACRAEFMALANG